MDILTFELSGKFAHFRKYYANNTALSYFVPPRTTLMGVIAAVMGYPRDSYYERLASEALHIGVRVLTPLKKRIHRVNWLKVEGAGDFRGRQQHTQTPFELVSGLNPVQDMVSYRVYLADAGGNADIFSQIRASLEQRHQVYTVSLGPANLLGSIGVVEWFPGLEARKDASLRLFHSALNSAQVSEIEGLGVQRMMIEQEMMPADFVSDGDREVRKMVRLLYTTDGQPMQVAFSGLFWTLEREGQKPEHISFIL
jgi:CRISPR-associated protein Cas5h